LIALTAGILIEYEEQISKHWNSSVALNVVRSLTELSSSRFVTVYYNLELITADPDDNKFVDCAFASNADFIISNDNHFGILKISTSHLYQGKRIKNVFYKIVRHDRR
jgi:putative PIN family toxin of toxin-antitoxin system